MKKSIRLLLTAIISISLPMLFLTGCGSSDSKASGTTSTKTEASTTVSTTTQPTSAPASTKDENSAINKNDTGKTVIRTLSTDKTYTNTCYMIISKNGTVAVADPYAVAPGVKSDIITSTHAHPDHIDSVFDLTATGKKSYYTVENFEVKDMKVSSIASSHLGDTINKDTPDNIIYVYEVDGLRIAHMGDIGQTKLTDEQMKALGKIDIAIMQFDNSYSDYSLTNGNGFKLIEQLKPQIIIPSHSSDATTDEIAKIVGAKEVVDDIYTVSKDDLKDGKRKVIVIKDNLAK